MSCIGAVLLVQNMLPTRAGDQPRTGCFQFGRLMLVHMSFTRAPARPSVQQRSAAQLAVASDICWGGSRTRTVSTDAWTRTRAGPAYGAGALPLSYVGEIELVRPEGFEPPVF